MQAFLSATAAFCPAETDSALRPWGDVASWPGGAVPAAGENVTLLPGMRLLLSSTEAPSAAPLSLGYVDVHENATLALATHALNGVEVHLKGITVRGELRAGTAECPVATSVVIELAGERLPLSERGTPPPAHRKGIYVTGHGVANLHGASVGARSWTRLASPHAAGATRLLVRAGAEAWPPGARVAIATTHFRDHLKYSENEVRTLTAVAAYPGHAACVASAAAAAAGTGGAAAAADPSLCALTELRLDAPLAHGHYAHERSAAYAAEVMLLTRSLVVRGSNASEYTPENTTRGGCVPFLTASCLGRRVPMTTSLDECPSYP